MSLRTRQSPSIRLFVVAFALVLELGCAHSDAPLRLGLGETVTRDLIATNGKGVLRFEGAAGRVLMVNLAGSGPLDEKGDRLLLIPAGANESEAILMSQDDQPGYWVGRLQRTGVYELILRRPSNKPYGLRITLMDAHDPRLDPGLSPDRVSLDTTLWGIRSAMSLQPFYPPTFAGVDDNWPAHLALITKDLQFRVMSVEGIKKTLWEDDRWMQGLSRLESALQPGGKATTPDLLPLAVYQDAALCFWGKQDTVEGKTWRGLRWVGMYGQDCNGEPEKPVPMNYVFEAISRDGKYFIMIFADITYLHPEPEWEGILKKEDALDEEENRLLLDAVNRRLDQAQPNWFKPDLRQLDAAVHSLELQ